MVIHPARDAFRQEEFQSSHVVYLGPRLVWCVDQPISPVIAAFAMQPLLPSSHFSNSYWCRSKPFITVTATLYVSASLVYVTAWMASVVHKILSTEYFCMNVWPDAALSFSKGRCGWWAWCSGLAPQPPLLHLLHPHPIPEVERLPPSSLDTCQGYAFLNWNLLPPAPVSDVLGSDFLSWVLFSGSSFHVPFGCVVVSSVFSLVLLKVSRSFAVCHRSWRSLLYVKKRFASVFFCKRAPDLAD